MATRPKPKTTATTATEPSTTVDATTVDDSEQPKYAPKDEPKEKEYKETGIVTGKQIGRAHV